MKIHEDFCRVDKRFIDKGLARILPYSIRFDRYIVEEEKAENREYSEKEWNDHCEEVRERISEENHKLMEYLSQFYKLGQYDRNEDCDDYDLWFWCNTTSGNRRDYSYVTLTFNKDNGYEANIKICEEIRKILVNYEAHNIQAVIQYDQAEIKESVEAEAERIYKEHIGKYITYGTTTGKLEKRNGVYLFKRKYAKKYAYRLSPMDVCSMVM